MAKTSQGKAGSSKEGEGVTKSGREKTAIKLGRNEQEPSETREIFKEIEMEAGKISKRPLKRKF